jgi:hypothetical protein
MDKTLSSQPSDWREGRRLRAYELKKQGWKQREIAEALGITEGAVSQWMKRAKEEGVEGLKHKPPPGAPPRLSEEQRERLPELSGTRSTGTRFSRRRMDVCESGGGDLAGVRGQIPPGAREPFAGQASGSLCKSPSAGRASGTRRL